MEILLSANVAKPGTTCDVLQVAGDAEQVRLDMTSLGFVGPLFLVRLRAWIDFHAGCGASVTVIPPADRNVANYMSRMHVAHDLPSAVDFPLPTINENPQGQRLIPVTRVDADKESDDFDELIGGLLSAPDMQNAGHLAEVVEGAASEMVLNAATHGRNATGAYVAAQRFHHKGSASPHRCVLAIGDMGIGMAEHLRRAGLGFGTDGETIGNGMLDMVTGTGEEWRGRGYSVPFELAQEKSAAAIELRVRANGGWVLRQNQSPPRALLVNDSCVGTWVEFQFAHSAVPS